MRPDEYRHIAPGLLYGRQAANALTGVILQHLRIMDDLSQRCHAFAGAGGHYGIKLMQSQRNTHTETGAAGTDDVHKKLLDQRRCGVRFKRLRNGDTTMSK